MLPSCGDLFVGLFNNKGKKEIVKVTSSNVKEISELEGENKRKRTGKKDNYEKKKTKNRLMFID